MVTAGSRDDAAAPIPALDDVRRPIDAALRAFLDEERARVAGVHPRGVVLIDEIARVIAAGGKRVRPAFCSWGFRAAGGEDGPAIVRAAASLELLHTFALVHDDVIDDSATRRGVASTHARFSAQASGSDPGSFGRSMAVLVGDLAAVLADRLFMASGFDAGSLARAKRIYDDVRVEMAVGELLDLSAGPAVDESLSGAVSRLKTGSYTIEGPLRIGASLARAPEELVVALASYARPLGEAFQVRDDLTGLLAMEDEPAKPTLLAAKARTLLSSEDLANLERADPTGAATILKRAGVLEAVAARVDELVEAALEALQDADDRIPPRPREALRSLALMIRVGA